MAVQAVRAWRLVIASDRMNKTILHQGLTLQPLTADVVARLPDLDPNTYDAMAVNNAWIDFSGNRRPAKLISQAYRPGDEFYYWDGPWGMLSGSRGIAVVRHGVVVATFTTLVS